MERAQVLVIEDDPVLLEMLKRLLGQKGHAVTGAASTEQGRAALRAGRFDLVLLDNVLPDETGLQALRRISGQSSAPVYLMSGFTGDELREDAQLLGAAGFLAKPIDPASLDRLIQALPERA